MALGPIGLSFIFQTLPPKLGVSTICLSLGLAPSVLSQEAFCPSQPPAPGERANLGMFALRPHAVFSLCPQPVNTETAPKNVVDTVSDSR